jgi:lactoylglutathione lyase
MFQRHGANQNVISGQARKSFRVQYGAFGLTPTLERRMLRKIDCIMIRVADVEAAAAYYAKVFGLFPQWREAGSVGLEFPETDAEIVLHCDPNIPSSVEAYYLVDDVVAAVAHFAAQGCRALVDPFDISIGKCAVIGDPFGTRLCILDITKGRRSCHLGESRPTKMDVMGVSAYLPTIKH